MARKLRVQYAGAIYHVINRGDRQEFIFTGDSDRHCFLKTLSQACQKTAWQVHAYCLMPNHFHLVLETPQPNLVPGMKWLLGTYTSRFNHRHHQCGHLFSGRYKARPVDGSGNGYLKTVCDYVHLNPVRAGLLQPGQPLQEFPWSSYRLYLEPALRPPWLRAERLLGEWRIPKDSPAGRRVFAQGMEARRLENAEFAGMEHGWCVGDDEFRRELLAQISKPPSVLHYGEAVQEAAQERAERLLAEEMARMRWSEIDLPGRRKGDPGKVRLALHLRANTTMPLAWIADRLKMGTRGYLTWLLQQQTSHDTATKEKLI